MAVLPTGIGPVTGYNIERSLRFNSADSAQLNRTFSTTGTSTKTLTFSFWVKRSTLGQKWLVGAFNSTDSSSADIFFTSSDTLEVRFGSSATTGDFITTQVFRDISSWYHIVVAVDTTQATNTNRFKLYVNGSQVTALELQRIQVKTLQPHGLTQAQIIELGLLGIVLRFLMDT